MGCDALGDGRAVAVADFNGDGRLDLVIGNNNAAPTVYLNNQERTGNWLRVDLRGSPAQGRDPLGARVQVTVDHDGEPRTMTRWVEAGTGYAAQSEHTLHFGLGDASTVESLSVTWPGRPPRRFGKEELRDMRNTTLRIDEEHERVRKEPADRVAEAEAGRRVRGQ